VVATGCTTRTSSSTTTSAGSLHRQQNAVVVTISKTARSGSNLRQAGLVLIAFSRDRTRYVGSWFAIDLVSVLPFWLLTFDFNDPMGRGDDNSGSGGAASLARGAVLFRVVKLLRMLKLARMLKAARLIRRDEPVIEHATPFARQERLILTRTACSVRGAPGLALDVLTNWWEWTYAQMKMAKLFALLLVYAHWQACLWALVSSYMQYEGFPNWVRHRQLGLGRCARAGAAVLTCRVHTLHSSRSTTMMTHSASSLGMRRSPSTCTRLHSTGR
jgi:hypothetical protein